MSMRRREFTLGLLVTAGLLGPGARRRGRAARGARADGHARAHHAGRGGCGEAPRRLRGCLDAHGRAGRPDEPLPRGQRGAAARRARRRAPLPMPAETMQVLLGAREVAAFTGGAFDASVGAYRDWHFGDDAAGHAAEIADAQRLAEQRRLVGWRRASAERRGRTARLPTPGMALDLGGIAKLPILRAGLAEIARSGVAAAMIDGGGDVVCRQPAGARLARRHPRSARRNASPAWWRCAMAWSPPRATTNVSSTAPGGAGTTCSTRPAAGRRRACTAWPWWRATSAPSTAWARPSWSAGCSADSAGWHNGRAWMR